MMSERDLELIKRIKKYCLNIEDIKTNFTKDFSDFEGSEIYQAAAAMFIMQIGECAKNISNEFKLEHQLFRGIVLLVYAIYMRTSITILTIQ